MSEPEAAAEIDRWKYRRRVIFGSLTFCAVVITYALASDKEMLDAATRQTAITQAFWSASAIIGAYVFGAVYDDKGRTRGAEE
jgi:Na+/H+-dicarboxylate symporter